jgi:hypothetical protein
MLYRFQSGIGPGPHYDPVYTSHSLAGCTARMQIRQAINSPVLVSLTSESGGLILEAEAVTGQIDLVISAEQSALLETRKAVYDLELVYPSGDVVRLLQGKITISMNVTE